MPSRKRRKTNKITSWVHKRGPGGPVEMRLRKSDRERMSEDQCPLVLCNAEEIAGKVQTCAEAVIAAGLEAVMDWFFGQTPRGKVRWIQWKTWDSLSCAVGVLTVVRALYGALRRDKGLGRDDLLLNTATKAMAALEEMLEEPTLREKMMEEGQIMQMVRLGLVESETIEELFEASVLKEPQIKKLVKDGLVKWRHIKDLVEAKYVQFSVLEVGNLIAAGQVVKMAKAGLVSCDQIVELLANGLPEDQIKALVRAGLVEISLVEGEETMMAEEETMMA